MENMTGTSQKTWPALVVPWLTVVLATVAVGTVPELAENIGYGVRTIFDVIHGVIRWVL
jgi:hypothetical protein